ncbi:MAG: ribonuclease III [Betaproteobacteria bacterium]|nr:ribonuclease III [Betaproteobacteria bacterium]
MNWSNLQHAIGYQFSEPELLVQALTHRSLGAPHNERLEFLGDSVLNCVIAAEVFHRCADFKEGELSRTRANFVRQETLNLLAQKLSLGQYLRLGEGEMKSGGHNRPSILADALEALLGAIFVDGGFESARAVVRLLYAPMFLALDAKSTGKDPKTMLQELLQARRLQLPLYAVVATMGAAHSQRFDVECVIRELAIRTEGSGTSRRHAEQQAALRAFEQIRR